MIDPVLLLAPTSRRRGVYIGPAPSDPADIDILKRLGVTARISLLSEEEEEHLYATLGAGLGHFELRCYPILDFGVPKIRDLAMFLMSYIFSPYDREEAYSRGMPSSEHIYLHCRGGMGRTGVMAGALLIASGMSVDRALAKLYELRGPHCPETIEQRAFLERNESHIRWLANGFNFNGSSYEEGVVVVNVPA